MLVDEQYRSYRGRVIEIDFDCDEDAIDVIDSSVSRKSDKNPSTVEESSSTNLFSMFGDVSVFREFFLAAFSDGYSAFNFCSSEGFFPGCSDYDGRVEGSTGRARSQARSENHQSTEAADPKVSGRQSRSSSATSRSSSSSKRSGSGRRHEERDVSPHLVKNSSGDDSKKRRRKKPLAVAVGFNYANDGHGRPIVVTPGGSNTGSFRRSPPSTLGPYSSGSGLHDEGEGMREGN